MDLDDSFYARVLAFDRTNTFPSGRPLVAKGRKLGCKKGRVSFFFPLRVDGNAPKLTMETSGRPPRIFSETKRFPAMDSA